mmetsp:Transcript_17332/g.41648  ORF Transcript_17332/g.41648 Transcript_17332/m.41648 type:complete len:265 (+) Transcript_17332:939-1733(+)
MSTRSMMASSRAKPGCVTWAAAVICPPPPYTSSSPIPANCRVFSQTLMGVQVRSSTSLPSHSFPPPRASVLTDLERICLGGVWPWGVHGNGHSCQSPQPLHKQSLTHRSVVHCSVYALFSTSQTVFLPGFLFQMGLRERLPPPQSTRRPSVPRHSPHSSQVYSQSYSQSGRSLVQSCFRVWGLHLSGSSFASCVCSSGGLWPSGLHEAVHSGSQSPYSQGGGSLLPPPPINGAQMSQTSTTTNDCARREMTVRHGGSYGCVPAV